MQYGCDDLPKPRKRCPKGNPLMCITCYGSGTGNIAYPKECHCPERPPRVGDCAIQAGSSGPCKPGNDVIIFPPGGPVFRKCRVCDSGSDVPGIDVYDPKCNDKTWPTGWRCVKCKPHPTPPRPPR